MSTATPYAPRSMPTGQRNVVRSNDSASLWNCTLSPGWTQDEVQVLRKALMKFGVGNWMKIIESECLPGKTIAQMNLQTQRMLGQQSTAEFNGLHLDAFVIGELNSKKQGPGVKRKNNCIVNTGGKLARDEVVKRQQRHREQYEVKAEVWRAIVLPKPENPLVLLEKKREELKMARLELKEIMKQIEEAKELVDAPELALGTKRVRE